MTRRRRPGKNSLPAIVTLLVVFGAALAWTKTGQVGARPRLPGTAEPENASHHRRRQVNKSTEGSTAYPTATSVEQSVHVALGGPVDGDPSDDVLIDHGVYVLSYNSRRNSANWVSWELDRSYLGNVRRKNDFRPDPALPEGFYRVVPADYKGTGYDRGHLCPSADREATLELNSLTFFMTNIQPQLHELNDGPWEKLEEYEREFARRRDTRLFIVAGGIFDEGSRTIGHGVAVPNANYKIIVALRQGQGQADVKTSTKVIAAVMPNVPGVGTHAWTDYLTSVDAIEKKTGYDFLSRVPKDVQDVIESRQTQPE